MTAADTRTDFTKKVVALIRSIPPGKVATYGLIAKLAGKPHGARGVGWILRSSTKTRGLPWQRVIKAGGRLPFPEGTSTHSLQKRRLKREGVEVVYGRVDLTTFLWNKKPQRKTKQRVTKA